MSTLQNHMFLITGCAGLCSCMCLTAFLEKTETLNEMLYKASSLHRNIVLTLHLLWMILWWGVSVLFRHLESPCHGLIIKPCSTLSLFYQISVCQIIQIWKLKLFHKDSFWVLSCIFMHTVMILQLPFGNSKSFKDYKLDWTTCNCIDIKVNMVFKCQSENVSCWNSQAPTLRLSWAVWYSTGDDYDTQY